MAPMAKIRSTALVATSVLFLTLGVQPAWARSAPHSSNEFVRSSDKATVHEPDRVCGDMHPIPVPDGSVMCTYGWEGRYANEDGSAIEPMGSAGRTSRSSATPKIPCIGNGASGKRIQVVLVHRGRTRLGSTQVLRASDGVSMTVAWANKILQDSAAQVGAKRDFRFVTDPKCRLTAKNVWTQNPNPAGVVDTMQRVNLKSTNRIYLMILGKGFLNENNLAGWTTVNADENPDPRFNATSHVTSYAVIAESDPRAIAHELAHTMGATHATAPGATWGGHCKDGGYAWNYQADVMCYNDEGGAITNVADKCVNDAGRPEAYYDCRKDTYFNPKPKPGSYLATHWNMANSLYLHGGR